MASSSPRIYRTASYADRLDDEELDHLLDESDDEQFKWEGRGYGFDDELGKAEKEREEQRRILAKVRGWMWKTDWIKNCNYLERPNQVYAMPLRHKITLLLGSFEDNFQLTMMLPERLFLIKMTKRAKTSWGGGARGKERRRLARLDIL